MGLLADLKEIRQPNLACGIVGLVSTTGMGCMLLRQFCRAEFEHLETIRLLILATSVPASSLLVNTCLFMVLVWPYGKPDSVKFVLPTAFTFASGYTIATVTSGLLLAHFLHQPFGSLVWYMLGLHAFLLLGTMLLFWLDRRK